MHMQSLQSADALKTALRVLAIDGKFGRLLKLFNPSPPPGHGVGVGGGACDVAIHWIH